MHANAGRHFHFNHIYTCDWYIHELTCIHGAFINAEKQLFILDNNCLDSIDTHTYTYICVFCKRKGTNGISPFNLIHIFNVRNVQLLNKNEWKEFYCKLNSVDVSIQWKGEDFFVISFHFFTEIVKQEWFMKKEENTYMHFKRHSKVFRENLEKKFLENFDWNVEPG